MSHDVNPLLNVVPLEEIAGRLSAEGKVNDAADVLKWRDELERLRGALDQIATETHFYSTAQAIAKKALS